MGLLMRKAKVTPSGTPTPTKPMNRGTAEQEQKGVTMPKSAAATVATTTLRPASAIRTFSGAKKLRTMATTHTMPVSRSSTFGTS